MPDPRSVMKEFRFLEQKRQAEGLSTDEQLRYGQLRDLVGGESSAAIAKPGFDVSAAAARLRESLMPAGLRNRPPPAPEQSPEPFGEIDPPAEEPPAAAAAGYEEQAWAPPEGEQAAPAADGLFDPGSLAEEGAYDPNAAAYDPSAAAAWDPNAAPYDPNAPAPYDPNAAAYDPNAAAAWDPNAAPYDPNAPAAWDPNAAAYDPNAAAAYDPNAAPYDPNAPAAYDPNTAAYDPNAPAAWDPNAAAYDPNAPAAWDPNAAATEPAPAADGTVDLTAPPEGEPDATWNVAAELPNAEPSEPADQPAWAPAPGGDYDAASWDAHFSEPGATPEPAETLAPPGPIDFGGYDDPAELGAPPSDLESLLPFDPAAEARVGPDMAQAFGPHGGELDLPGADIGDQTEFHAAESMGSREAPGWQPEPGVVDQGFELASGGSFDASADAAAPEWAAPPSAEAPAWDAPRPGEDLAADDAYASSPAPDLSAAASLDFSAPELTSESEDGIDLSWAGNPAGAAASTAPGGSREAFELSDAPETPVAPLDLSAPDAPLPPLDFAAPAAGNAEPARDHDDIPTLDADDILEEVPADLVEPPEAAPATFEPPTPFAAAPEAAYGSPEPLAYEPPPAYAAPLDEIAEVAEAAAPEAAYAPAPEPPQAAAYEAELPVDVVETTPEPEVLDPGLPAEDFFIAGSHRVVVHTVEGQVKRGFIEDADLAAPELALAAVQGGATEPLSTDHIKAIFFMLAPGEQPTAPQGSRVRVTFRDGRQVAGFSPDYREGAFGFYMIQADARTSTARIWVYSAAVKSVAVS